VTDAADEKCAIEHVFAPVFRDCPLGAVHACPEGVPARPTPKATGEVFRDADPSLPWREESGT
jgi:hypothetical protein